MNVSVLVDSFTNVSANSSAGILPESSASDHFLSFLTTKGPSISSIPIDNTNMDGSCRSNRLTQPPSYLKDFHCHLLFHKTIPHCTSSHHLHKVLFYDSLSSSHQNFVLNVSSHDEP